MSTLYVNPQSTSSILWSVYGLGSNWTSANYNVIRLTTGFTANGSSSYSGSSIDVQYPPTSNTVTNTPSQPVIYGSASSTYTLYAAVQAVNGLWYDGGSATFTMPAPPLPSQATGLSASGSTSSFSVSWSNGANTDYCTVWLQGVATYTASYGASSFSQGGLSLTAGNTYFVTVTPHNGQGAGTDATVSFVVPVPPPPPPSGLTGLTATGNNGYVHLSWNTSSGATSYDVVWSGGSSGSTSISAPNTTTDVMGLTNGASYTFTVTPRNSGGTGSSQSQSATPQNRPTNFAYSPSLSKGTAPPTASQWNLFTSKVNAFRLYKGYGTYAFTTAPVGKFYAWQFNEAVNGLGTLSSYMGSYLMPTTKNVGDILYASQLNDMVTSMNSIS